MGNLCIIEDNRINEIKYFRCKKCDDTFRNKCGGYSERTSCRFHDLDKEGECKNCHIKNPIGNCYHVKKISWF